MIKTLELQFTTQEGGTSSISIEAPKESIDPAAIKAAMEAIIAGNAFTSPSGGLVAIKGARLVAREVTQVEIV
ncbi:DUF2922 domain-containing protein [Jeotgalibacillus soli]|uniref:DUF2922 domain-containing protein n=1 Tax=Jeotgalibacillus soli TaxID=889306 RepID=A0A0C2V7Y2_9BACL|nr:DUF2922 domain-containing protein [Jeotgalibacillus soli]KIL45062.1 hypothetical protein KP78_26060 [Jeotgalibacillus soli]